MAMDIKEIYSQLGAGKPLEQRADGWWLEDPDLNVEKMAQVFTKAGARLVTMTAIPASDSECRIAYHWDLKNQLVNFITSTHKGSLPSIANICPAANWIEREIHDYFAISFTGREMPPLVLRQDDLPGIFRWDFRWKDEEGEEK